MERDYLNGRLELGKVRGDFRNQIIQTLVKLEDSKILVIEPSLKSSVVVLVNQTDFTAANCQIQTLSSTCLNGIRTKNVVFLIKGEVASIEMMARVVKKKVIDFPMEDIRFHVMMVPRGILLCDNILKEEEISTCFDTIQEVGAIYPLDSDVITLDIPRVFHDYYLKNDSSTFYQIAQGIHVLEKHFGQIPHVIKLGKAAEEVDRLWKKLTLESGTNYFPKKNQPEIDEVIIIDRNLDLMTPLLTQFSYEGLIDELFGIRMNISSLPPENFKSKEDIKKDGGKKHQINLNSGEGLFKDTRDSSYYEACNFISSVTKNLTKISEQTSRKDLTITELRQIVSCLPFVEEQKRQVSKHIALGQLVREIMDKNDVRKRRETEKSFFTLESNDRENLFIEKCLFTLKPKEITLRLMCLQSMTRGIRKQTFDSYKTECVHSYGLQMAISLLNLEKVGMLKPTASNYLNQGNKSYQFLNTSLSLTQDKSRCNKAYELYDGYVPITTKLVEMAGKNVTSLIQMFQGVPVSERLSTPSKQLSSNTDRTNSTSSLQSTAPLNNKMTLVVFVGGCTFSEISCLRLLSKLDDATSDYLVLTTEILNGNTFISNFQS